MSDEITELKEQLAKAEGRCKWQPIDAARHMRHEIAKWLHTNGFSEAVPLVMELPLPFFSKMPVLSETTGSEGQGG